MGVDIETGPEFDKQLAKLAWEHADKLTKESLASTVALAIASDANCLKDLKEMVCSDLADTVASKAKESAQFSAASSAAIDNACKLLSQKLEQKKLLDSYLKSSSDSIKKVVLEEVRKVTAKHILAELSNSLIQHAVIDAIQSILRSEKGLLRTQVYERVSSTLDTIKAESDNAYAVTMAKIHVGSKDGNWP